VFAELRPAAIKTGMLFSVENISVVADFFKRIKGGKLVVDPVMVATSGARLLKPAAEKTLKEKLLPLATLVTPNLSEFRVVAGAWVGERDLTARAQKLRRALKVDALLVTRSEEGMTLFTDRTRLHEPAQAREVYDVSGAGDTVIATLAVMLASGVALAEAVHMANRAAGIVVGKFGTAVVQPKELFGQQP